MEPLSAATASQCHLKAKVAVGSPAAATSSCKVTVGGPKWAYSADKAGSMFSHFRRLRDREKFTDLRVYCGLPTLSATNSTAPVYVHRAVIASCSAFLASLLLDRSEHVDADLVLPEANRDDFLRLVQLLYGEVRSPCLSSPCGGGAYPGRYVANN